MPKELYNFMPAMYKGFLLREAQWREIGIRQSPGWEHYMIHRPEPVHSLLFTKITHISAYIHV